MSTLANHAQLPCVLLHGINNSPVSWEGVVGALAGREVHVPLLSATPDVDDIAAQLLAELPERFVLVGHSFGGYVSLALLAAAPERIAALALVNSLDNADTEQAASGRRAKAAQALAGEYAQLAAGATQATYHPDNLDDDALMRSRARAVEEYGAERFAAHQEASAKRPARRELLAAAAVPVLVVAADEDRVIATDRQREMATAVGAAWRTISGAGHMLPAERPRELAAMLSDWFAEVGV